MEDSFVIICRREEIETRGGDRLSSNSIRSGVGLDVHYALDVSIRQSRQA